MYRSNKTCIVVLIAAATLSLVSLLVSVSFSRQDKIPAWKLSLLAVLLAMATEYRNELGGVGQLLDVEERATNKHVRLEADTGRRCNETISCQTTSMMTWYPRFIHHRQWVISPMKKPN